MKVTSTNFARISLGFELDEIRQQLSLVKSLSRQVERHIFDERRKLEEWINQEAEKLSSEEQKQDLAEFYAEEFDSLKSDLPAIQRNSMFISCYISLENHLNMYCQKIKRILDLKLNTNDMSGHGIERSKKYISKVAGVNFPSEEREWREIKIFNKIRNAIIHRGGIIDKITEKNVLQFIETHPFLHLDVRNKIVLGEDFAPYVSEIIENFFKILHARIMDKATKV